MEGYPIVDLVENQIIAAVRSPEDMEKALSSTVTIIFLLFGHIGNLTELVQSVLEKNKKVFLHLDFIEGIATDRSGISYIAQYVKPTGVITTRTQLIQLAKECGLMTIQRLFLIDSTAIKRGIQLIKSSQPDAVEIMPGLMPRVIQDITKLTPTPIIVGGLIQTKEEILNALAAGALAVSVGTERLWKIDL